MVLLWEHKQQVTKVALALRWPAKWGLRRLAHVLHLWFFSSAQKDLFNHIFFVIKGKHRNICTHPVDFYPDMRLHLNVFCLTTSVMRKMRERPLYQIIYVAQEGSNNNYTDHYWYNNNKKHTTSYQRFYIYPSIIHNEQFLQEAY